MKISRQFSELSVKLSNLPKHVETVSWIALL